jgi:outer membrane protein W
MKKLILSIAACAMIAPAIAGNGNLFSTTQPAGDEGGGDAFGEGKIVISAGYGFPNLGKSLLKAYQNEADYSVGGIGPLHGKFEYGLSDKIGIGVSFNYVSFSASWKHTETNNTYDANGNVTGTTTATYSDKIAVNTMSALLRLNVHFATTDKLDPYWGIGAGYRTRNYKYETNDPTNNSDITLKGAIPFGFETTFGVRYFFTDNIGAYAELGIGKSLLQGGLAVKF